MTSRSATWYLLKLDSLPPGMKHHCSKHSIVLKDFHQNGTVRYYYKFRLVSGVEASGKFLLQELLCYALVTILCVADVTRGAGVLLGRGLGLGLGRELGV